MPKESDYQSKLNARLESIFPGCIITKNDSRYIQGIPDWTIFYGNKYAMYETKKSVDEPHRPNQDYYVDLVNDIAFAMFVYPENEEEFILRIYEYFAK